MFTIEGTHGTAACYATNIEDECVEQIRTMLGMPFAEGANTAIMPDAHFGIGCTIGTTMRVAHAVVPNLVGVDIGCGMLTADLGHKPIDLPAFDEACHEIPSGARVWDGRKEQFDFEELRCYRELRDVKRLKRSLGTLGGGNHFIEIDIASDGMQRLVIHSGSRNLGLQVANYYQGLAVDLHSGKEGFFERKRELIDAYKAAGRRDEIQASRSSRRSTGRRTRRARRPVLALRQLHGRLPARRGRLPALRRPQSRAHAGGDSGENGA